MGALGDGDHDRAAAETAAGAPQGDDVVDPGAATGPPCPELGLGYEHASPTSRITVDADDSFPLVPASKFAFKLSGSTCTLFELPRLELSANGSGCDFMISIYSTIR